MTTKEYPSADVRRLLKVKHSKRTWAVVDEHDEIIAMIEVFHRVGAGRDYRMEGGFLSSKQATQTALLVAGLKG